MNGSSSSMSSSGLAQVSLHRHQCPLGSPCGSSDLLSVLEMPHVRNNFVMVLADIFDVCLYAIVGDCHINVRNMYKFEADGGCLLVTRIEKQRLTL